MTRQKVVVNGEIDIREGEVTICSPDEIDDEDTEITHLCIGGLDKIWSLLDGIQLTLRYILKRFVAIEFVFTRKKPSEDAVRIEFVPYKDAKSKLRDEDEFPNPTSVVDYHNLWLRYFSIEHSKAPVDTDALIILIQVAAIMFGAENLVTRRNEMWVEMFIT